MSLSPGTRIGAYEITGLLGAGGMGEVYRARDSKLKREVAIKVLPADVAADPERLARFQREAEVLASLNHPHIAHVYGIEDGALVMELVEGEDLSQRIARGPIPIDEALPIARQIAEALEAAHDAGIIHRDLKPANIKVRDDGTVKVLDFGLAKALDRSEGDGFGRRQTDAANSPTITSPAMTMRGVILGTAAYMSPEQAKGKVVDRRTDIWAFGCVLYEMLTGKRTFAGDDVSDTLVAILRDDPRWAALPLETPPHVKQLLRRCLQKDPQKRLPHIGAARLELADGDTRELAETPPLKRWYAPAAIAAIAAVAAVGLLTWLSGPTARVGARPETVQFAIEPPAGSVFIGAGGVPRFAVSPDGRRIVYQLQDKGRAQLWIRSLDAVEATPVSGTEERISGSPGAQHQQPFWSPDGRYLGFFDISTSQLKKLDLQTSLEHALVDVPGAQASGSWNRDNAIIYSSALTGGIRTIAADGGTARQLTTIDESRKEANHLWAEFLSDGRQFVYLVTYVDNTPPAVHVASLDGRAPQRLLESPAGARVAWPDRLLYVRGNALVSQRFDVSQRALTGDAEIMMRNVPFTPAGRLGVSAALDVNVIAYATGGVIPLAEGFVTQWIDRQGNAFHGAPPSITIGNNGVRLTQDGLALLYARGAAGDRDDGTRSVWVQDTVRGIETRHSADAAPGTNVVVSPDGSRIVYRRFVDGQFSFRVAPLSGSSSGEDVYTAPPATGVAAFDWTRRDELVFGSGGAAGSRGIWIMPIAGDRKPVRYVAGEHRFGGALSPDGRWLAYAAGSTMETAQVFIQPFPDPASGKWPVSPIGAGFPRWRADGREIFFTDARRQLIAVPVSLSPRVAIGTATPLFSIDTGAGGLESSAYPYDVLPDGNRFVVARSRLALQRGTQLIVDINR